MSTSVPRQLLVAESNRQASTSTAMPVKPPQMRATRLPKSQRSFVEEEVDHKAVEHLMGGSRATRITLTGVGL